MGIALGAGDSRAISGVDDLEFTLNLMGQVFAALWQTNSDCDKRERDGTLAAMIDIKPRDALEGMLIGQAIASHNAAMECYRRAMINEQTFEGRRENLNQANKLSRTFAGGMSCSSARRPATKIGAPGGSILLPGICGR